MACVCNKVWAFPWWVAISGARAYCGEIRRDLVFAARRLLPGRCFFANLAGGALVESAAIWMAESAMFTEYVRGVRVAGARRERTGCGAACGGGNIKEFLFARPGVA